MARFYGSQCSLPPSASLSTTQIDIMKIEQIRTWTKLAHSVLYVRAGKDGTSLLLRCISSVTLRRTESPSMSMHIKCKPAGG